MSATDEHRAGFATGGVVHPRVAVPLADPVACPRCGAVLPLIDVRSFSGDDDRSIPGACPFCEVGLAAARSSLPAAFPEPRTASPHAFALHVALCALVAFVVVLAAGLVVVL